MHVPPTAKQPLPRLMPFANVEVAVEEVMLSAVALTPPPKVDVPTPKIEVVAVTARKSPLYAERSVVEVFVTVSKFVFLENVKLPEPLKLPPSLNCPCVSEPPGVPEPLPVMPSEEVASKL